MREGLLAELEDEDALAGAVEHLRSLGYRDIEAFTPFPSERVLAAMRPRESRLPWAVLLASIAGAALAYAVMYWTNVRAYPLDIGGRDPHPWPAFVPITFETAILFGGVAAFVGFFALTKLPRLWQPLFEVPAFARATDDGFFLAVSAADPRFDSERTPRDLARAIAITPFPERAS